MSKFYADSMLGKLSRFLRFLGYDTLYRTEESIDEMFKAAREEERLILTRSEKLIQMCSKRNLQNLFISSIEVTEQLIEIKNSVGLNIVYPPVGIRCSVCNGDLRTRNKDEIIDKIPEGTAKNHEDFWECSKCHQIYWMGSHWQDIKKTISEINSSE